MTHRLIFAQFRHLAIVYKQPGAINVRIYIYSMIRIYYTTIVYSNWFNSRLMDVIKAFVNWQNAETLKVESKFCRITSLNFRINQVLR